MISFLKKIFGMSQGDDSLAETLRDDPFLVDVRTPAEFFSGNVKGSINIPLGQLHDQLSKFEGQNNIVVFCQSGMRSSQAKSILSKAGFQATNAGSWQSVAQILQPKKK